VGDVRFARFAFLLAVLLGGKAVGAVKRGEVFLGTQSAHFFFKGAVEFLNLGRFQDAGRHASLITSVEGGVNGHFRFEVFEFENRHDDIGVGGAQDAIFSLNDDVGGVMECGGFRGLMTQTNGIAAAASKKLCGTPSGTSRATMTALDVVIDLATSSRLVRVHGLFGVILLTTRENTSAAHVPYAYGFPFPNPSRWRQAGFAFVELLAEGFLKGFDPLSFRFRANVCDVMPEI